jgi:predicted MFS family arabinose efflux permease
VLAGAAAVAAFFSATPFVIPEVVERLGVGLGAAGMVSTVQVGAFAIVSASAGRLLVPGARLFRVGMVGFVFANLVSATAGSFEALLVYRAAAGAAAGLVTWVAWSDAAASPRRLANVAAAGPLAAVFASLVFGWLSDLGGDRAIFLLLAAAGLPALTLPTRLSVVASRPVGSASPSRSNRMLLASLALVTMAGSSLFVYAGVIGTRQVGLSATVVGVVYSLNAAAGLVGTRLAPTSGHGAPWLISIALCVLAVGVVHRPAVFLIAMIWWGFGFWMAVPPVFRMLAERSATPHERVGDAQALMAVGRAVGPLVGGLLIGDGEAGRLGVGASLGILAAGLMVAAVGVRRRRAGAATSPI